jgi:biotin carboxylase
MKKHIVCIASELKGEDFLDEAHNQGWHVTLLTRRRLLDAHWPRNAVDDIKPVENTATPADYVRAITNIVGTQNVDRVVGLDEFDVITAALAREHLQMSGLSSSYLRRFRDKLTMRSLASESGIACPQFIGAFNMDRIREFLEQSPGPWIVKPRTEVSAFGIRKCEVPGQVWAVLNDLDDRNSWRDHPSQFLIEQFIKGRVFHVDSVVNNGKIVACGVSHYGTTPYDISHHGGVFTTSVVDYRSEERRALEASNAALLSAFEYQRGVSHAEFLQSEADGKFYLLEVACRVGGAYIANVLEHARGFNLWREWAKLETTTPETPYKLAKLWREYAGIAVALSKTEEPDTSAYVDDEIVYRVNKPRHVGFIFRSNKHKRVNELLAAYSARIKDDFLAVVPPKEHYNE